MRVVILSTGMLICIAIRKDFFNGIDVWTIIAFCVVFIFLGISDYNSEHKK